VGSVFNVQQVERRRADLAFTQSDIAYLSYQQAAAAPGPASTVRLRGIAVLYVNILHILGRGAVRTVGDLRGRHVGVGAPGSGTEGARRLGGEGRGLRC